MKNFVDHLGNSVEIELAVDNLTPGLMTQQDKIKLDNIAEGANNYTHPSTHPATMITEDTSHKFVTDSQISTWNAKASTAVSTTSANGLMSSTDKSKLDGIATGANAYVHPGTSGNKHIPSGGATGQILRWSSDGTAAWGADNNTTYNNATTSAAGLMSAADKTKLDGITAGANAYTHPSTHPASIIVQDSSNRFVTDTEKATWNAKASTAVATTSANGLMSSTDKTKLNGIATGANAYSHPTTSGNKHIPSGGSSGQILRWSADGTAVWGADNNTTYNVATTTTNGLMSAADKVKLNGLSAGISYEYGTSGTSQYKKYSDGTLEMWGTFQLSYTNQLWVSTLGSSGFSYSVPFNITLPVTAVGNIECNINIESINVSWASIQSYTSTVVKYILVAAEPDKQYDAYIHWSVKGKWK